MRYKELTKRAFALLLCVVMLVSALPMAALADSTDDDTTGDNVETVDNPQNPAPPSPVPSASPAPQASPEGSPLPSASPEGSPAPTVSPAPSASPSASPSPDNSAQPTASPAPTGTPAARPGFRAMLMIAPEEPVLTVKFYLPDAAEPFAIQNVRSGESISHPEVPENALAGKVLKGFYKADNWLITESCRNWISVRGNELA